MVRASLCLCVVVGMLAGPTWAAVGPADAPVSGYFHRAWTEFDDRHLPPAIRAITQDKDGYIWIGFLDGLVRFDGARFIGWDALRRPPLPSRVVVSLVSARDGSLWIGFGNLGGVARFANGVVRHYQPAEVLPAGAIRQLLEDHEGGIWAAGYSGLARFQGSTWERIEASYGLPPGTVHLLFEDAQRTLWVGKPDGLYRRQAGQTRFARVAPPTAVVTAFGASGANAPWKDLLRIPFLDFTPTDPPPILSDRRGHLWTTGPGGLLHVTAPDARGERASVIVRTTNGLTSDRVVGLFEDRDGNIWVGTEAGLDMFAPEEPRRIMNVPALSHARVTAVATGADGTVWAGTPAGLYRHDSTGGRWYHTRDGLPSDAIRALHVDHSGTLWLATERGVARFIGERVETIPLPRGTSFDRVVSLTTTPDGTLWLCDFDTVVRWQNGVAVRVSDPAITGRPSVAYTDSRGRVWIGFWDGGIAAVHDRALRGYPAGSGLARGRVTSIYEDSEGAVWVGTLGGVSRFDERGRFESLPSTHALSRLMVSSIVEDDQQRMWIRALSGLVRFDRREFTRAVRDPAHAVPVWSVSPTESMEQGVGAGTPNVTKTPDGLLWFARRMGIALVDPSRLHQAPPPPVRIERVLADDGVFEPAGQLSLPAKTARVQIDYTSLTFASPGATQFRYKLDGFDSDWVDAGLLRQAFYTNLPPRRYSFRVAASQDGGSWSEVPQPLELSVRPAFYQTTTFSVLLAATAVLLFWGAWRWRLHAVRREYALVLAERARLGREIHDTLLQGMVGVALQLHGLSETLPETAKPLKTRLDRARDGLEHYIRETRGSIWNLRSPTLETSDLASALRDAGDTITAGSAVRFELVVTGRPIRCAARIEEHLLRIAHEAIVNAVRHASPTVIKAELAYEPGAIRVRVRDDGRGFNPEDITHTTGPRWGLTSMRERAQQMGARFSCISSLDGGTEVVAEAPSVTS